MIPSPRSLLLSCLLASAVAAADHAGAFAKPNLVWDGDTVTAGAGWAKAGGDKPATFVSDATEAAHGKVSLKLHAVGEHWVRAGWRWTPPASAVGFNVRPYTHLYMAMRAKVQVAPTDIKLHLVGLDQAGKRVEGPEVSLNTCAPKVLGGGKAWIDVLVPLADLCASKELDTTNINEVMFVVTGGASIEADVQVDDIGFTKAGK